MNLLNGTPAPLDPVQVAGTSVLRIRGTDRHLVRLEQEKADYVPVDRLDGPVSSSELEANYGVWADRSVESGALWWKKTVRLKDGLVQPDEVQTFAEFRASQETGNDGWLGPGIHAFSMEKARIDVIHDISTEPVYQLESEWSMRQGYTPNGYRPGPLTPEIVHDIMGR